jgi:hypothetical protein
MKNSKGHYIVQFKRKCLGSQNPLAMLTLDDLYCLGISYGSEFEVNFTYNYFATMHAAIQKRTRLQVIVNFQVFKNFHQNIVPCVRLLDKILLSLKKM